MDCATDSASDVLQNIGKKKFLSVLKSGGVNFGNFIAYLVGTDCGAILVRHVSIIQWLQLRAGSTVFHDRSRDGLDAEARLLLADLPLAKQLEFLDRVELSILRCDRR
jgi:hypothetical protein